MGGRRPIGCGRQFTAWGEEGRFHHPSTSLRAGGVHREHRGKGERSEGCVLEHAAWLGQDFGGDFGATGGSAALDSLAGFAWEGAGLDFLGSGYLISARRRKMLTSISH